MSFLNILDCVNASEFLNRDKKLAELEKFANQLNLDPSSSIIVSVNGAGGIGKSELIREFRDREIGFNHKNVSLDISINLENLSSVVDGLWRIRTQCKGLDCRLFDIAFIHFHSLAGIEVTINASQIFAEGTAGKIIDIVSASAGLGFPLASVEKLVKKAIRGTKDRSINQPKLIKEILELSNPCELETKLPIFLAMDIGRETSPQKFPFIVYESFDKIFPHDEGQLRSWLAVFLRNLNKGLHLIISRSSMVEDPGFKSLGLKDIQVDRLENKFGIELIDQHLPDISDEATRYILEQSDGNPFIIQAFVHSFSRDDDNDLSISELSRNDIIEKFLKNIREHDRELVIAISTIQFFDRMTFMKLAIEHGLRSPQTMFRAFQKLFFVEPMDTSIELFKTHDLLSNFYNREIIKKGATLCLSALTALTSRIPISYSHEPFSTSESIPFDLYIGAVCARSLTEEYIPSECANSLLLDLGFYFYDRADWESLVKIVSHPRLKKESDTALIAHFFAAISIRRISSVKDALEKVESILQALRGLNFSHNKHAIDIEYTYLKELSGDYSYARERFGELYNNSKFGGLSERCSSRINLYYSDLLTMDGKFMDASLIIKKYLRRESLSLVERIEQIRQLGHCYRFSYMFDEAVEAYEIAISLCDDNYSLQAKLKNNIAEVECWANPEIGVSMAKEGLEAAMKLKSRIEIGKSHTAMSVALAQLGDTNEAFNYYKKAYRVFSDVNYQAGLAFSDVARCAIAVASSDIAALRKYHCLLRKRVEKLGSYFHLPTLFSSFVPEEDFSLYLNRFAWIERSTIRRRIEEVQGRFEP